MENKRLGEVLAFIKAQQDTQRPVRVQTNSERIGYRKTGRKPPGRPCGADLVATRRAAAAAAPAPG